MTTKTSAPDLSPTKSVGAWCHKKPVAKKLATRATMRVDTGAEVLISNGHWLVALDCEQWPPEVPNYTGRHPNRYSLRTMQDATRAQFETTPPPPDFRQIFPDGLYFGDPVPESAEKISGHSLAGIEAGARFNLYKLPSGVDVATARLTVETNKGEAMRLFQVTGRDSTRWVGISEVYAALFLDTCGLDLIVPNPTSDAAANSPLVLANAGVIVGLVMPMRVEG